jgi:hypothetical protein
MEQILPLINLKVMSLKLKLKTFKVFDGDGLYLEILPAT